jgi:hypothetical protein
VLSAFVPADAAYLVYNGRAGNVKDVTLTPYDAVEQLFATLD